MDKIAKMWAPIMAKAKEGGFLPSMSEREIYTDRCNGQYIDYKSVVCNPRFWQALGKSCGWPKLANQLDENQVEFQDCVMLSHTFYALRFHEINLTDDSWEAATIYLQDITK